jgi:hypothetical protein
VSPARAATQRTAARTSTGTGVATGEPRANAQNRPSRDNLGESAESNTTWGDEEEAKVVAQLSAAGGSVDSRRSAAEEDKGTVENLQKAAGSGQGMVVYTPQQPAGWSRRYGYT